MNSVLPFTYTLSAQVYVNDFAALGTIPPAPRLHPITPPQPSPTGGGSRLVATGTSAALIKNTGSAPAHRHYPNPPTAARTPTVLPPPPWGRDGVMAASTPQSDKYKIAHHPYSPTATALPPSPCGGGAGGGVCPHTSLANRQPAKPFTYTTSAQVYVNHPNIGCALAHHRIKNAASAINGRSLPPPQPSPGPHSKCVRILNGYPPAAGFALRGREPFRCIFRFRSLNSHNECAPARRHYPNPPTTARIPTALPPPPWGRVGVVAANTPRSDKTTACAPAHRHYPNPPTATRTSTTLPPSPAGRSPQRGRAGVGGSAHDFAANAK